MKKRIVSILLTLCMVLCLMPTAVFAGAAPTGTALTQENISSYKQEKDSTYSENGVYLPTGSYYLAEDIYLVGDDADPNSAWPLIISGGDVTLDLNGHVLDLRGKNISIFASASLTLTDSNQNAEHKFRVEDSGLWVWDETQGTETVAGGVITGGAGVNGGNGTIGILGGGVNVSGGSLTMNGGSIVGCTANSGGGVRVSRGSFTMNGGRIAGCTAVKEGNNYGSGGGVRVDESGSFTMEGGSITNCKAGSAPNAVHADGDFTDNNNIIDKSLVTRINAGHAGTEADPILIATPKGLEDFRDRVNKGETTLCARLTADIVLNDGTFDADGNYTKDASGKDAEKWTPVNNYTGTFDGNGKTVRGLYVTGVSEAGLFATLNGSAAVKNLTVAGAVEASNTNGDAYAGGIAAKINGYAQIINCTNNATVKAAVNNDVDVNYTAYTGGIAGYAITGVRIIGCTNNGTVRADSNMASAYTGGIAGYASGSYVFIENCLNTAELSAVAGTSHYLSDGVTEPDYML